MANTYTPAQAIQMGQLGQQISARQEMIAKIQAMITAGNYQVSQFTVVDPANNPTNLLLATLDAPTSQAALQYALNVYQTQLTTLTTQLAAI